MGVFEPDRALSGQREWLAIAQLERPELEVKIDDTDIQRLADLVMDNPVIAQVPPDTRASVGHDIALVHGMKAGLTDKGAKELAALVKRRIEWTDFASRNERSQT